MAAAYRLVVTTVNCYSSVVIDCHFQRTVHYCSGTCQVFKQGIACIVAHHSICAELLRVPASNVRGADLEQRLPAPENGLTLAGNEDYQHILPSNPRLKKGSSVQAACSLKDITGEAINLASGKIKEFSFERLRNPSSHVSYRKGRKVRSESFNRRSLDFDLIYGHFNNDENCPPFSVLQNPSAGEKWQESCNSPEGNVNTAASLCIQPFSEESFITQILEKHKLDSSSGGDIKVCLDILLKCSEDLKKCTDIIKHCIKKKSASGVSGENDDDSLASSEMIYMNLMTRFSAYLKKLPVELKQPSHVELSDLAELVTSLHGLQQAPFSPVFGSEQPPRYEDIVQLPSTMTRPSLAVEVQDGTTSTPKPIQTNTGGYMSDSLHSGTQQNNTRTVRNACTVPPLLTVSPSNCVSSTETLYIEEESDGEILGKEKRAESKGSWESLESSRQKTRSPDLAVVLKEAPARVQAEALAQTSVKKTFIEPVSSSLMDDSRANALSGEQREPRKNNQDEIDKLLLDLEHFSQKMESTLKEPTTKENDPACSKGFGQEGGAVLPLALETKNKVSLFPDKSPTSPLSKTMETNGHKMEEEDKALLLRILESIEDFAQELVECHMGKGSLSKEKEMMQILQETLTTPSQSFPAVQRSCMGATTKDTVPALIQQAPEVIKVQNKQEKKPGTPSPAPLKSAVSPRPLVPVNKVLVNAPVSINIPHFYFPKGLPNVCTNHEETIARIEASFTELEDEKANIYEMGKIAKVCGCPLYWKAPIFNAAGGERTGFVSVHSFVAMWRRLLQSCHDDTSKFLYLLAKPNCNYLEQEDFIPLLQDVVETHPGLTFLKDAPEFHSRYITTVIQRIFYMVNRSWSGKITLTEMRKSNFLQTLALLEEEDDINQITDYFSYEHFYVIYCKFWELDTDHDLSINQKDLARYNDQALSTRIIERIFSGAVVRGSDAQEGRMSYADFVWLLIAEEDKRSPTSIEYWFRCMDLDGDGVLSMYELEHFYEEQCERMEVMGIEPLPFQDLLCQMLDLVKPDRDGRVTLRDLKRCRMAHVFYNTFFNLEKYLDNEQRDPFAIQKDIENDGPEPSDWDRYAAEEYELLVAEESGNEQLQEGSFEEDYETDEFLSPLETGDKLDKLVISDLS